jgi:hypothetical protein
MDVLEHVHDDDSFFKYLLEKIQIDDLIFITVPAFQFLFSNHDMLLKHHRRYNRRQLLALLHSHNVSLEKCHYFYMSLFFARFAGFLLEKLKTASTSGIGNWNFNEKHIITRLIYTVLNIDFCFCDFFARFRIYLPGLSLLAVCRKKGA